MNVKSDNSAKLISTDRGMQPVTQLTEEDRRASLISTVKNRINLMNYYGKGLEKEYKPFSFEQIKDVSIDGLKEWLMSSIQIIENYAALLKLKTSADYEKNA